MTPPPQPAPRRSILLAGLRLLVAVPAPLLWTYAFNLGVALLFSLRLHAQLSSILDHSLAAERLNSAFDLGALSAVARGITSNAPDTGATSYAGLPLYLLAYFILVPGSLFCFLTKARFGTAARLSVLASSGLAFFWRFVRITLLTVLASLIVLGPLLALQTAWMNHVSAHTTGNSALFQDLAGWVLILLAAALLRLYFDLVEVYTVQLGEHLLPSGKPDRRVRRTLLPAFRTLRLDFPRAYGIFLALTLLGLAAVFFTGRVAAHMLAQPKVLPIFLLAQLGLFLMLLTRFWQRTAETVLASDFPLLFAVPPPPALIPPDPALPSFSPPSDPQPNPEPIAPSLPEPDPGVFHHTPKGSDPKPLNLPAPGFPIRPDPQFSITRLTPSPPAVR